MAASDRLVIVESSGSLADSATPELIMGLEAAAHGESGCSYAFQSYARATRTVSVDFHVAGDGGLGSKSGAEAMGAFESMGGGGGTYLNELFGLAVLAHAQRHGGIPSTIVFWSDFVDKPPDLNSMGLAAHGLSGARVICAVSGSDQNMEGARRWALRLGELTGAECLAVPDEGLKSWAEAKQLRASTPKGSAPSSKRRM